MTIKLILNGCILFTAYIFSNVICAEAIEYQNKNVSGNFTLVKNRGFIAQPSTDLKKRFQSCDEFLKVDWINKNFGYVNHELYKNGVLSGKMKSLVYVSDYDAVDRIELFDFEKSLGLEKLFSIIREGTLIYPQFSTNIAITYKNSTIVFQRNNVDQYTYANNLKTVCVPYQKEDRAWVVEMKSVEKIYDSFELDDRAKKMEKYFPGLTSKNLLHRFLLDINNDSEEDFLSEEVYIYSKNERYFVIEKLGYGIQDEKYFIFGHKGSDKSCKIYSYKYSFITTDGKDYFLNNQCSLTNLISN